MSVDQALSPWHGRPAHDLESRRLPIGAQPHAAGAGGVHFRVWAPIRQRVDVVFEDGSAALGLEREEDGYFSGLATEARVGSRYRFRLDGKEAYPDPASRFQPEGPHGPSEVIDASRFPWTDQNFPGVEAEGQILYEMHVGAFTPKGTWEAAARELEDLKKLGITCLEIMPVADFAGKFGWGYDGVNLFAPTRLYGSPDDFRRFVDQAHALDIGVILDLVYNHFGPDGNYLAKFSDHYLTDKHKNDWGQSINFDGENNRPVREFFVTNARYWIEEFHLDGFRFDATQAILDCSPKHILAELAEASRKAAGKKRIYLIAESEPQHTCIVRSSENGGYGMDSLWNDDFHHAAMVRLTGRNEAYYTDYRGTPQEFISGAKYGYLYQGQFYKWQRKRRGTRALDLLPTSFVNYIQNHDQIANYGHGWRACQLSSIAETKAMTALLILGPQTPLLFMGQEYAARQPFYYFADHTPELAKLVREGRAKEVAQFPSVAQPEMQACLPDPAAPETFQRSRLDRRERIGPMHAQLYELHKDLLKLRREEPVFRRVQKRGDVDGAVLGHDAFVLRYFSEENDDRLLVINFGVDLHLDIVPEPLMAPPVGMKWALLWSSEDPKYYGSGTTPIETHGDDGRLPDELWHLPGRAAMVLRPVPLTSHPK